MTRRVAALLFDLNGTLVDSSGANRDAVASACGDLAAAHPGLDAGELLRANREAWTGWWAEVEADWTLGRLDGGAVTREAWRRTLAACGRDDPQLVAAACEAHSSRLRGSLRLFPEVAETLASLSRDYALALVSNGASDTQRETLRRLGIEGSFRAFAISGELGIAKPDGRIFEAALEALGVGAGEAWHVGDDPEADVAGAHGAGLTVVWVDRARRGWSAGGRPPELAIESLAQLRELLPR